MLNGSLTYSAREGFTISRQITPEEIEMKSQGRYRRSKVIKVYLDVYI